MSRPTYDVKETYTGTGTLDEYTFDFKIEALTQLLVIEVDDDGVETQRVRGDDTVYLDSVDFDAVNGGGTVTLAANLTTDYTLILLLANDEPVQDYELSNKTSFNLKRFEYALDAIMGAVQRLTYRGKQAFKIHDLDDEETFNAQFPPGIADQPDKLLKVNLDGDGLDFTNLTEAEFVLIRTEAEAAQLAAEAAQAAAEAEAADALASASAAASAVVDSEAAETAALAAQVAAEAAQTAAELALTNSAAAQAAAEAAQAAAADSAASLAPAWVATENIGAGGEISNSTAFFQNRKVQGSGAARITSTTPFGTAFATDGATITLAGQSDTNTVQIPYSDTNYGCLLNGTATLGKGKLISLRWDNTALRWYEVSRNF